MSSQIAAMVAHAVFWALIVVGFASDELTKRTGGALLLLWLLGFFGLEFVAGGVVPFSSYVALLDVALVFIIFRAM